MHLYVHILQFFINNFTYYNFSFYIYKYGLILYDVISYICVYIYALPQTYNIEYIYISLFYCWYCRAFITVLLININVHLSISACWYCFYLRLFSIPDQVIYQANMINPSIGLPMLFNARTKDLTVLKLPVLKHTLNMFICYKI